MRSIWKLFLVPPLLMTPWVVGCGPQRSQEAAEDLSNQIAEEDAAANHQDAPLENE